jgi:hypothetical protein
MTVPGTADAPNATNTISIGLGEISRDKTAFTNARVLLISRLLLPSLDDMPII